MSKFIKWKSGYQCGNCNWFWGTELGLATLEKIGQFCRHCGHVCSIDRPGHHGDTDRPGHDVIYRWVPAGYFEVQRVFGPEDKQYFTKQGHRISKEKAISLKPNSV